MSNSATHEHPVREIIAKIDAAWRLKQFDGLDKCFHEDAIIVGPGYTEFARGREKCAESYREFATNADVLSYSESSHTLHTWETTAVYTFAWEMQYQRQDSPKRETGTDQLVFQFGQGRWQLVWRYIYFEPSAYSKCGPTHPSTRTQAIKPLAPVMSDVRRLLPRLTSSRIVYTLCPCGSLGMTRNAQLI